MPFIAMITDWWNALDLERQIFYAIGVLSLLVLVIQLGLTLLGLDGHDLDGLDASNPAGPSHGDGLGIFSVRTITAFLTGFGWMGAILLDNGHSLGIALLGAFASGTAFMFGIYFLFLYLMRLQASGTMNYKNAVGQIGTVYTTIPAANAGSGQIEVMIQGRLTMAEARCSSSHPLAPGVKVRVTELLGLSTLVVEPIN